MEYVDFMLLAEPIIQLTVNSVQVKWSSLGLPESLDSKIKNSLSKTSQDVIKILETKFSNKRQTPTIALHSIISILKDQVELQKFSMKTIKSRPNSDQIIEEIKSQFIKPAPMQLKHSLSCQNDKSPSPMFGGKSKKLQQEYPSLMRKIELDQKKEPTLTPQHVDIDNLVTEDNAGLAAGKLAGFLAQEKRSSVLNLNLSAIRNPNSSQNALGQKRVKLKKISFVNGTSYEGEWLGEVRDGQGTEIFMDGIVYKGTFQDDEFHGHGLLTYPDGKSYEGDFQNGQKHGRGVETDEQGVTYEGSWLNGKKDGNFSITLPQNTRKRSPLKRQSTNASSQNTHREISPAMPSMRGPGTGLGTTTLHAIWKDGVPFKYDTKQIEVNANLTRTKTTNYILR